MTEQKDEKTIRRHAWPPPKEAERVVMPQYFVSTEERGSISHYALVRVVNGKPEHVIRTTKYKDLLETIIQDALVPVFKASPLHLVEAMLGEARWKYGDEYEFTKRPDYLLEPDFDGRDEAEVPSEPAPLKLIQPVQTGKGTRICPIHNVEKLRNGCRLCRRERAGGSMFDPVCSQHGRKHKSGMKGHPPRQSYKCKSCQRDGAKQSSPLAAAAAPPICEKHGIAKVKDGHNPRGQRRWRCLVCNPRRHASVSARRSSRKGTLAARHDLKTKDNPKCETCGERLGVSKRHKLTNGTSVIYWKCINKCAFTGYESEKKLNQLPTEVLLPAIEKVVKKLNGHAPQDGPDIAQSIALDLHRGILKPADLYDRERIRRYIDEQKRFSADGRRTLDLDAPVGNDDSKITYADAKPAPAAECDPHQQLEAKEAVESRLREQPAVLPYGFVAPTVEGACEAQLRAHVLTCGLNPEACALCKELYDLVGEEGYIAAMLSVPHKQGGDE